MDLHTAVCIRQLKQLRHALRGLGHYSLYSASETVKTRILCSLYSSTETVRTSFMWTLHTAVRIRKHTHTHRSKCVWIISTPPARYKSINDRSEAGALRTRTKCQPSPQRIGNPRPQVPVVLDNNVLVPTYRLWLQRNPMTKFGTGVLTQR